ncbi:unnamed protein product [Diabrotica balteata]|uniref:Uncharacterized protein n=1 Tax=Diabrotica balteata TaxID=107213 RepID=A0A9N9X405_DIABA|nr:unnamed protein product [Diabrotica balteata]
MNTVIVLFSLVAITCAAPQYLDHSSGGDLGGHKALSYQIIGLSRGSEDHEEEHEERGYGGHGGNLGGGHQVVLLGGYGHDNKQEEYGGNSYGYEIKSGYGKHDDSIGFTGSDFKTPVDVHHEKEIHIKANPEYHYDFHVADHKNKDYKSKTESREGDKVKGSYSLLEPDHKTVRVVDYVSDKKLGFIAKVSYRKQHGY